VTEFGHQIQTASNATHGLDQAICNGMTFIASEIRGIYASPYNNLLNEVSAVCEKGWLISRWITLQ